MPPLTRRRFSAFFAAPAASSPSPFLNPESFRHHIDFFNRMAPEEVVNAIPDAASWEWLRANIPLLSCPDPAFEQTWYYRWWALRKHIKSTPKGYIFTEFLKPVGHGSEFNAISCALGHHIHEARWLQDQRYLRDDIRFWLQSGPGGTLQPHYHRYSSWTAHAVLAWHSVWLDNAFVTGLLDSLLLDYRAWEQERLLPSRLFWQYDVRDGMEESISGSRTAKNARPTINSYMYGNARAIANIARLANRPAVAKEYEAKAATLRRLVQDRLWDPGARFFKPLLEGNGLANVRELIGYTPWYFHLPEPRRGSEAAWSHLMDPQGFHAPFGPTTAEQRHPGFQIADSGDDCQWNGPSWPFSTTVTLKALANTLHDYHQKSITSADYFKLLLNYSASQRLKLPDGRVIPWIDENLNPFTGEWQARSMRIRKGRFNGRGDHYNHSGFADLVITGLAGLRPHSGNIVEISPLLPANTWDRFTLDRIPYHGRLLTIHWDRPNGLRLYADRRELARAPNLQRLTAKLD